MQLFVEAHCHVQNVSFITTFHLYKLNAQLLQFISFAIAYQAPAHNLHRMLPVFPQMPVFPAFSFTISY